MPGFEIIFVKRLSFVNLQPMMQCCTTQRSAAKKIVICDLWWQAPRPRAKHPNPDHDSHKYPAPLLPLLDAWKVGIILIHNLAVLSLVYPKWRRLWHRPSSSPSLCSLSAC